MATIEEVEAEVAYNEANAKRLREGITVEIISATESFIHKHVNYWDRGVARVKLLELYDLVRKNK